MLKWQINSLGGQATKNLYKGHLCKMINERDGVYLCPDAFWIKLCKVAQIEPVGAVEIIPSETIQRNEKKFGTFMPG